MNRAIVLYLHVHQPFRVKHYTVFDIANSHNYFDAPYESDQSNEKILKKIAEKSYLPTNSHLLKLLNSHPEFKISLSITGTLVEQLKLWSPETLASFQELVATGRVELLAETYHHSLAFFYDRAEFETQVDMHAQMVRDNFGQSPQVFRNTELAYNNDLAYWADKRGYKAILAEGWDKILGWRSPNYLYEPAFTDNIKLLMKNYKLSDDIAFRFGDRSWSEWPLTADKFAHWLNETSNAEVFNLFMDYETFGEHQWVESGIFGFLQSLPNQWLKNEGNRFYTVSEAVEHLSVVDKIDVADTITWADTERDLSAWLGNSMQQDAIKSLYSLTEKIIQTNDLELIEDWRKLQTSDHFYYMCTKWFNDGDIHAYFSPYDTPYEAAINFMNAWHDVKYRLSEKGIEV